MTYQQTIEMIERMERELSNLKLMLRNPTKIEVIYCFCGHQREAHCERRELYAINPVWHECSYTQCSCTEFKRVP